MSSIRCYRSGLCGAERQVHAGGPDAGSVRQRLRGRHLRAGRLGEREERAQRHHHGQGVWLRRAVLPHEQHMERLPDAADERRMGRLAVRLLPAAGAGGVQAAGNPLRVHEERAHGEVCQPVPVPGGDSSKKYCKPA